MIIGIIGGIGSGKSTVSEYLENRYGFIVFKSDAVAKEIMTTDPEIAEELKGAFGDDIYNADGSVNREKYASVIYSDEKNRILSDSIIHPACWKEIRKRVSERMMDDGGNDFDFAVETALPSDILVSMCDEIWFIYADPDERIKRLIGSRGYTREYADSVIKNQLSYNGFMEYADRLINNGGTEYATQSVIDRIISDIRCSDDFC